MCVEITGFFYVFALASSLLFTWSKQTKKGGIEMSEVIKSLTIDPKEKKKLILTYAATILLFIVLWFVTPENVQDSGVLTVVPAAFLLVFIFYTKRILEGLILGTVLSYFMIHKGGSAYPIMEAIQKTLMSDTFSWFLMVCGTLGGIIALLQYVGASEAFSNFVVKRVKSRRSVLIWTMLLGFVIFIDDYINVLIRGTAMAKVTDRYRVSREFLAYVIDSSAAAACILIPFSTWAIFISGLLEENGLAKSGEGLAFYMKTMPFNFYAICSLLILVLSIIGVIKPFGPMKKAELEAQARWENAVAQEEEKIQAMQEAKVLEVAETQEETVDGKRGKAPKLINFLLPILVLIVVTIYFDIDAVAGIFATVIFMFIFYIIQRLITPEKFAEVFVEGMQDMVFVLLLMLFSLTFADGIDAVGCMDFMIDIGVAYANPKTFAFIVFVIFGCTEFVMGLVWSLYIVAFPIVIPIAANIGADPILTIAAVCSAGVWGSNTCFYVDCTILSAQASGITPFRHGITQMPYALVAVALSGLCFLACGFIL